MEYAVSMWITPLIPITKEILMNLTYGTWYTGMLNWVLFMKYVWRIFPLRKAVKFPILNFPLQVWLRQFGWASYCSRQIFIFQYIQATWWWSRLAVACLECLPLPVLPETVGDRKDGDTSAQERDKSTYVPRCVEACRTLPRQTTLFIQTHQAIR